MAIIQQFDLNMIPDSDPVVVHVNQYDTGTGRLVARLYSGNVPYSPVGTAAIQGTKPDGIGFMYSATIDGNTVTANLTDQMSVIAGSVRCQIVVTETSGMTGTFCFDLEVQPSALPDDTSISESDYPIIEEMIRDAQEAAADATIAKADAENAASDSEAWAVGTRGGDPVDPSDPTYQNNSKYYAEHGGGGSGGHVIMDESGNDMPARGTLQFLNMEVTDDPTHLKTVVTGSKGLLPYLYIDSEAGATVTVTAPDSSTITPTAAGSGHWECELGGYGVYVIHSVLNGDDATYSLTVDSVKEYHVTDTHYDFTINVTTHSGATIRVSAGTEIYTETGTGSPVPFVVHQASTVYTIEVTYQGHSASQTVTSAATTGQSTSVTINVVPDGSTVTPTDDIQTWLNCANIWDKAYTTLNEVLADPETLYILMGNNNAVDYLVRSTTWVSGITADETAMKYIGKWNYASDTLLDDSTWFTAIAASTYKDYVLNFTNSTMTGASTPSGYTASASNQVSGNEAYKAFDHSNSTEWKASTTTMYAANTEWVALSLPDEVKVKIITLYPRQMSTYTGICDVKVEGKNTSDNEWTTIIDTFRYTFAAVTPSLTTKNVTSDTAYNNIRVYMSNGNGTTNNGAACGLAEVGIIGRSDVTEGIDVYGAAGAVIYYMDGGSQVIVDTLENDGHKVVPKSSLPNGTYTLYSTVAKDPTNLSNDYSKSVTVTDGTSEIYVMPDNTLYWWGYIGSNLENVTTANGWSYGATLSAPTYNSDNIETKQNTNTSMAQGVGTASAVQLGTVNFVAQGVSKTSWDNYGLLKVTSTKSISSTSPVAQVKITSTALTKLTATPSTSGEYYFAIYSGAATTSGSQDMKTFAIWLE